MGFWLKMEKRRRGVSWTRHTPRHECRVVERCGVDDSWPKPTKLPKYEAKCEHETSSVLFFCFLIFFLWGTHIFSCWIFTKNVRIRSQNIYWNLQIAALDVIPCFRDWEPGHARCKLQIAKTRSLLNNVIWLYCYYEVIIQNHMYLNHIHSWATIWAISAISPFFILLASRRRWCGCFLRYRILHQSSVHRAICFASVSSRLV